MRIYKPITAGSQRVDKQQQSKLRLECTSVIEGLFKSKKKTWYVNSDISLFSINLTLSFINNISLDFGLTHSHSPLLLLPVPVSQQGHCPRCLDLMCTALCQEQLCLCQFVEHTAQKQWANRVKRKFCEYLKTARDHFIPV